MWSVPPPGAKACLTDVGHHAADDARPIRRGCGRVHELGIEQTVRESRLAAIGKGSHEIQVSDLARREVFANGGPTAAERLFSS